MPRLFAAIEIGGAAQERVAREQARLADITRGSLRWVRQDQLHLTLVFLGEVPAERAESAIDVMHRPLAQTPFRFELGGIGAFPPRGAPRALWIGVKSGANEIIAAQAMIAERLEALGFERERRPFSPHLTLARWRDSRPSDRPDATVGSVPTIAKVDATAITLFQSRVSSGGSTYTRLVECVLRGGGAGLD